MPRKALSRNGFSEKVLEADAVPFEVVVLRRR